MNSRPANKEITSTQVADTHGPSCLSLNRPSSRTGSVRERTIDNNSRMMPSSQDSASRDMVSPNMLQVAPSCSRHPEAKHKQEKPTLRCGARRQTNHVTDHVTTSGPPKYPKYAHVNIRLSSFSRWPRRFPTPGSLAEAGLFYTGLQDGVRCFHCNGGMRKWDDFDDPWIEHARNFPDCPFLKAVKGDDFIKLVKLSATDPSNEEEVRDSTSDTDKGPSHVHSHGHSGMTNRRESRTPVNPSAVQYVIASCGFSEEAVSKAVKECENSGRRWDEEILVNTLLDMQDRHDHLPATSLQQSSVNEKDVTDHSKHEETPKAIKEENRKLKRLYKCNDCSNESNILFLPCSHHLMCQRCSERVTNCPKCGSHVDEKIRTYIS